MEWLDDDEAEAIAAQKVQSPHLRKALATQRTGPGGPWATRFECGHVCMIWGEDPEGQVLPCEKSEREDQGQ